MGAMRTYQKRFEHQAAQRLERSYGDVLEAEMPDEFLDLLRQADDKRRQACSDLGFSAQKA